MGLCQWLCIRRGQVTSGVLFLTWVLLLIFGLPEYRYWWLQIHVQVSGSQVCSLAKRGPDSLQFALGLRGLKPSSILDYEVDKGL